ncbi:hypothetical protein AB4Y64_01570 [Lysobacter sp. TAF61]|uniref:hypothetical protein n=1 Tax=Lysobacter sp. TAF61 TaxID=3233072 RepID=UPI003F9C7385
MTTPLKFYPDAPRAHVYAAKSCSVLGCERQPRSFHSMCSMHALRLRRQRCPVSVWPTRQVFNEWRAVARWGLNERGLIDAPATRACAAWLERVAKETSGAPPKLQYHLDRLSMADVRGEDLLERTLAVYLLRWHAFEGSKMYGEATFRAYLGNVFVRTARLEKKTPDWITGKSRGVHRPSGTTLEELGAAINAKAGPVLLTIANRIRELQLEALADERELTQILREHPLP